MPPQRQRKRLRLANFDYSSNAAYFVTICTNDRACLFGDVVAGSQRLSPAGLMVERWWTELARKFPQIETDAFVVMPNHVHAIVVVSPVDVAVTPDDAGRHAGRPLPQDRLVPRAMQWFKTMTTNDYLRNVASCDWPALDGKLWQRSYYDHVVRDERSLHDIRRYIENNPAGWADDEENPGKSGR